MFNLNSKITIGDYSAIKPVEVTISRSVFDFSDKATIKLTNKVTIIDGIGTDPALKETHKLFAEGDRVRIELGYNNALKEEFIGFVSRINLTSPVAIECEGYSYLLRKKTIDSSFKDTTLKEILQFLINGTEISLAKDFPEMKINKWFIDKKTAAEVIQELKDAYPLEIFFRGSELAANLQFLRHEGDVRYRLNWNVIKADELKYRQSKTVKVEVHFAGDQKDGREPAQGSNKQNASLVVAKKAKNITEVKTLNAIAEKEAAKLSYNGYEGKITCFLQPFCIPGSRAIYEDRQFPEKNGNYYVQATEVSYSVKGARRSVTIGAKLN
jgi:hypothetical protein